MKSINMRMPEDVIRELKEMAPRLGFSGYQPLIRFYIGRGMRADAAALSRASRTEAGETTADDADLCKEAPESPSPENLYIFPIGLGGSGRPATREEKVERLLAKMAGVQR